ncbi:dolichyl-diphosphooligosaccharide---protein glycosyltransferase subunit MAGT1/TUSC3 [Marchantia polymorpha subsp. ruderalis]|uniref:Dolichyl-diphosphooligosaccharide--protein glycosyltransferase subunit 3B n=2 Tax=Marchantia polymorpha TaxID=3197 RepID=A0AAF6ATP9_MARPO|nr:hypothetical protein MARPO_0061s0113 [Marchantia polymorpha]BBM99819.1 hypothetical protein Mp_1g24080 [Marchantia polymorpha subsp. ruderalis]|eukprot:PTQ36866.1 hypothetical protein MARPO_0061s0113 [Marchantia polymorpha]
MSRSEQTRSRMARVGGVLLVALVLLTFSEICYGGNVNAERIADLLQRQARSADGVVRLDDESLRRFANPSPEPRPYSLVIFFDASQLRDNAELRLEELRREYGLAASAHAKGSTGGSGKLFFCELEFKQAQASFAAFGVSTLPHIKHLPPGGGGLKEADEMEQSDFHRTAEGMISFVEGKSNMKIGPVERPPSVSTKQLLVLAGGLLVTAPFVIKRILAKDTVLHDSKFWCLGAVLVYFFSVSGGMHNIIRRMPFVMPDRNNPGKLLFFYQGSGMQLGAEGFVVGSLYSVVGLLLAFVTHFLHEIRSKAAQRFIMLLVMAIGFTAVRKVITLDNWKTGYWIHGFWPNSWR